MVYLICMLFGKNDVNFYFFFVNNYIYYIEDNI